jgi:hypothetical protein
MADYEEAVAREVHTLLLSAKPETTDKDLASAAERASFEKDPKACRSDDFRAGAFSAIQDFRNAIVEGASHSERKRRLRHAVNCAHGWLNARRFPNLY